jgi:hypothetical protein
MFHARSVASLVALGGLAILASPVQAQERAFEWTGTLTSGQILEVKGIVGEIRATPARDNQVRVLARKGGDEDDFAEVAIEVAEAGDRVVVCAVYGSWRHGQNRCHPDHEGDPDPDRNRNRNNNIDVDVFYEVQVPAGVEFEASMVTGDIEAEGLRSDVYANTVTGNISIVTAGRAWANSVSGDMEIEMGDLSGDDLDFSTVSGDITLWLPSDFTADLRFSSISGDLDSDFDLEYTGNRQRRWVGSRIQARIGGGGGRELSLQTVSGDVELRRRG